MRSAKYIAALGIALMFAACGGEESTPANNAEVNNGNGKGDTPLDDPDRDVTESCEDRRALVLEGSRELFTDEFIRWSCADVSGVNTNNKDSRGQEYCEYFAMLRLPPEDEGGEFGATVDLGRNIGEDEGEVTALSLELSEDQIFYLEDHITEPLGSCVFTSWHGDVPGPVPACESEETCPSVEGIAVDEEFFRMKVYFNSNFAAQDLVRDCAQATSEGSYQIGDAENEALNDDFMRGCQLTYDLYQTEWRKSDSSICAATMRLTECGCVGEDFNAFATAVVPTVESGDLRGFPLGGWAGADRLPSGCRYVELGDESQTIVTCDLTGGDIIQGQSDLKGLCRQKYGDNVVVHVPLPTDAITCDTPDGPYSDTCTATPWIVER